MWICPDCNTLAPNPVKKKCINGHPLWNGHIMGPTREQSFGTAFITAFIVALLVFLAALAASRFRPDIIGPDNIRLWVPAMIAACGLDGLWHGRAWSRRQPSRRLAPRAFGMGCGCLAAAAASLAVGGVLGRL
jgi:hypothetical protein